MTVTMSNAAPVVEVPEYFHMADTSVLTHMIADMLLRLTAHNDQIPLTSSNLTRFHSRAPPAISILDYLRRIVKYASVERICLLILLIYIDRVCERNRTFTISSLTVHRFIITGVTVASKALCDSFLQNSMYAKVGGISTKELNILELEFLCLIDWRLTASAERLQDYYQNLVRQHPNFKRVVKDNNGAGGIVNAFGGSGSTGNMTATGFPVDAEFGSGQQGDVVGIVADGEGVYQQQPQQQQQQQYQYQQSAEWVD
ncbi:hypothetical protein HDU76_006501 [Blyttiomyces sp. JEL0837]|nr:hypothetical protein HDU76_006501 [Blyttiomyces sp. JEL0837]